MNVRGNAGPSIMVGPAEQVEARASAEAIGAAILTAISRSRLENSNPMEPWVDSKAPESAGFKSYGDLERGAALLGVQQEAEQVKVGAWRAKGGGYEPVPGAERICDNDPAKTMSQK